MPLTRLRRIVRRLRAPRGCPWDRRQTHRTLKACLVEETYEVLDAIERDDAAAMREELGDLLLQCVFHAVLEEERGRFTLEDAIRQVCAKLVRRHPHVFARGRRVTARGALTQWEILKRGEQAGRRGLDGVPRALPALLRAARIQDKAARQGFEWQRFAQARAKLGEELRELDAAIRSRRKPAVERELGDALFALAKVGRFLRADPEDALQAANDRFTRSYHRLERAVASTGRRMHEAPPAELYALWRKGR